MKSTDQFFPWIVPMMEMANAAQMSQTRKGIFHLSQREMSGLA